MTVKIERSIKNLFNLSSMYCGVFMEEDVMKKIVKLQAKYNQELREILNNNKDKLYPYSWTLSESVKGKTISFIDSDDMLDIDRRIKNASFCRQPEKVKYVYIVSGHKDYKERDEALKNMDISDEVEDEIKPLF